jgi:hypothetical protein
LRGQRQPAYFQLRQIEAALRRFSFKLRFLPLTAAQRLRMFAVEALGWRPSEGRCVSRLVCRTL